LETGILSIPGFSEPVSCFSHLLGAGAAAIAGFFLVRKARGSPLRVTAASIFLFAVIFLLSMSGVYHLLEPGGAARAVLQRLDHAAIWVLIAGTFTPIHLVLFRGFWRWGLLSLIWAAAVTGLVLKTLFFAELPEWAGLVFYAALGWMGLLSSLHYWRRFGGAAVLPVLWGGLAYTAGAVLEFTRVGVIIPGVIGHHELFHFAVITGVIFHWRFVYQSLEQARAVAA
jgi:channel protein (hemolysin III family)